jgi:hypothetical protein
MITFITIDRQHCDLVSPRLRKGGATGVSAFSQAPRNTGVTIV